MLTRIVVLSLASLVAISAALLVNGALTTRIGIEENPTAHIDVRCDGIQMTQRACQLRRIIQQEPLLRRSLITMPLPVLFGGLYLLSGLAGGIISSWLRLAGLRHSVSAWPAELLLLIVAGLAGLVACAALLIPGMNTLSVLISQADNEMRALQRSFGVALLAGTYAAGFFLLLERTFLSWFEGRKADASS